MSRAELSLDRFLDGRITGCQSSDASMCELVAETCDEVQNWANRILPGEAFSAALRVQLLGDGQPLVSASEIGITDPWSLPLGSIRPTPLLRRVCEIAAMAAMLVVGVNVFVQWVTRDAESPKFNAGASISLPSATIESETSHSLPQVHVYDSTRNGALLKVDVDQAQLRAEPSFDGGILRQLTRGEQVRVIGTGVGTVGGQTFFLDVETSDALRGWIWQGAVTLSEEEIATQNAFTPIPESTAGSSGQSESIGTTGVDFAVDTHLVVTKPTRLQVEPGSDGYAVSELEVGDSVWSRGVQIQTRDET